jgi:hypothetical protein
MDAAATGAWIGAMLWLVLRRQVSQAGWWVLAGAVSCAMPVYDGVQPYFGEGEGWDLFVRTASDDVATIGALTGIALVSLLQHPAKEA